MLIAFGDIIGQRPINRQRVRRRWIGSLNLVCNSGGSAPKVVHIAIVSSRYQISQPRNCRIQNKRFRQFVPQNGMCNSSCNLNNANLQGALRVSQQGLLRSRRPAYKSFVIFRTKSINPVCRLRRSRSAVRIAMIWRWLSSMSSLITT